VHLIIDEHFASQAMGWVRSNPSRDQHHNTRDELSAAGGCQHAAFPA